MGGKIEPRSCAYCHYFGHTKQHCAKRKRDEDAASDKLIAEDLEWMEKLRRQREKRELGETQAEYFDRVGVAYVRDPIVGPILCVEDGEGDGRYKIVSGRTVRITDE